MWLDGKLILHIIENLLMTIFKTAMDLTLDYNLFRLNGLDNVFILDI